MSKLWRLKKLKKCIKSAVALLVVVVMLVSTPVTVLTEHQVAFQHTPEFAEDYSVTHTSYSPKEAEFYDGNIETGLEPSEEPEVPEESETPEEPEVPKESETPEEPEVPDESETPDESEASEEPETPICSETERYDEYDYTNELTPISDGGITWQSPDVVVPAGQNYVYIYFTFDRPAGVARPMGFAGTSIQLIYPQGAFSPSIPLPNSFIFAEPNIEFCECCFTPSFTGQIGGIQPLNIGDITVFGGSVTQLGDYDGEIVIRARLVIPAASPLNNPEVGFVDISVRRGAFSFGNAIFSNEYSTVRITREGVTQPPTFAVAFDLAGGTRTGGGELIQGVPYGANAILPIVTPPAGYEFVNWSGIYTNITSDRIITAVWQRSAIQSGSITWQSPDVIVPAGQDYVYIYFTFDRPHGVARPMGFAGTSIQLIYPQGSLNPSLPLTNALVFAEPNIEFCECCFTSSFSGQIGALPPLNIGETTIFSGAVTQLGDYDGEIVIRARLAIPAASPLNNPEVGFVDVSVRRGAFSLGPTIFPNEYSSVRITREVVTHPPTFVVTFDLGLGTHTGGGELSQEVSYGTSAILPTFIPPVGYEFVTWNGDHTNITSDRTITATWQRSVVQSGSITWQSPDVIVPTGQDYVDIYFTFDRPHGVARPMGFAGTSIQLIYPQGALNPSLPLANSLIFAEPNTEFCECCFTPSFSGQIGAIHNLDIAGLTTFGGSVTQLGNYDGEIVIRARLTIPATSPLNNPDVGFVDISVRRGAFSLGCTIFSNEYSTVRIAREIAIHPPTFVVTFDLGDGTHTGGGELNQEVRYGASAILPTFVPPTGYEFINWDGDHTNITSDRTITAVWQRSAIQPESVTWQSPNVIVPAGQNHVYIYFTFDRPAGVARPMGRAGTSIQLIYPQGSFSTSNPWASSFVFAEPSNAPDFTGRISAQFPQSISGITTFGGSVTQLGYYDGEIVVRAGLTIPAASPLNNPEIGFVDISVRRGAFSLGETIFPNEYSTVRITRESVTTPPTFAVAFDLAGGTRTGGGELNQEVPYGANAVLPLVTPPAGYEFSNWSGSHTNITSDRTITAVWQRSAVQSGSITWQSPDVIVPAGQNHVYIYFTFDRPDGVARPMGRAGTSIQLIYPQGSFSTSNPWASSFVFAEPSNAPDFTGRISAQFPQSISGITTFGGSVTQLGYYDGEIVVRAGLTIPAASPLNNPDIGFVDVSVRRGAFSIGEAIFPNEYSTVRITRGSATPPPTFAVSFDLAGGTRTGGGELNQEVPYGANAVLPIITPPAGYEFINWSGSYTNITSDRTITAVWQRSAVQSGSITWQSPDVIVPAGQNYVYIYFTFDRPDGVARPMGRAGTSIQLVYPQGSFSTSNPWASSFEFAEPSNAPDFTGRISAQFPQSISGITTFGGSITQLGYYDGEIVIRARLTIPAASPLNNPAIGFVDVSVRRGAFSLGTTVFPSEDSTVRITRGSATPPPTFAVSFDLAGGVRTGGGELSQQVPYGANAVLPVVTPPAGYEFSNWNGNHTNITSDRTITAVWMRIVTQSGSVTWQSPDVIVPAGQNYVYIYFTFDRPAGVARPMGRAGTSIQLVYPQGSFSTSNPWASSFEFAEPSNAPDFTGRIGAQFPQSISGITTFGGSVTQLGYYDGEIVIRARLTIPAASPLNNPEVGFVDVSVRRGAFSLGTAIFPSEYSTVRIAREGVVLRPTSTVTFHPNGGVFAGGMPDPLTRTILHSGTYAQAFDAIGRIVNPSVDIPTLTGYAFWGWFSAPVGGYRVLPTNAVANVQTRNLYAQWVRTYPNDSHVVDFLWNDGSNNVFHNVRVLHNTPVTPPAAPTRQYYTFLGWSLYASEVSTPATFVGFNFATPITADITLYAIWYYIGEYPDPIYFHVNFMLNRNAADNTVWSSSQVRSGTTAFAPALPHLNGYEFLGWSTERATPWTAFDFATPITADLTLYAQWLYQGPHWQVVTFDPNGGEFAAGTPNPVTRNILRGNTYAQAFNVSGEIVNPTVAVPTRPGYSFIGWFSATSGGYHVRYTDTVTNEAARTFIAQWTPDNAPYQIAFHIYTRNANIRDMFAGYATYETSNGILVIHVPVIPGVPSSEWPNQELLNNALNIGRIYGHPGTPGYAFWGWFQGETLDRSGRFGANASLVIPNPTNSGLRRPSLADRCEWVHDGMDGGPQSRIFDLLQSSSITQTQIDDLFVNGTLDLFAIWSLWGDVDDNDVVNMSDLFLLQTYFLFRDRFPNIVDLNLRAADVFVNGIIDWTDYNHLELYVTTGHSLGLGLAPQSQPLGGSVTWQSPDVVIPAGQNYVYIYFTLDRPAGVARPMGYAGTAIRLTYPQGSLNTPSPLASSFMFVEPARCPTDPDFAGINVFAPFTAEGLTSFDTFVTQLGDHDGEIVIRARLLVPVDSPLNNPDIGYVDISVQRGEFSIGTTLFPREYSTVRVTRDGVIQLPTFIVTFDLGAGTHIGGGALTQEVHYGVSAALPRFVPPVGYQLSHWDGDHTNITSNRTITAMWQPMFTVTFDLGAGTHLGGGALSQEVPHGTNAVLPTFTPPTGYIFSHWDGDHTNIISNRTITAVWRRMFTVTFDLGHGTHTGGGALRQEVLYGASAVLPAFRSPTNYQLSHWDGDHTNITSNRTITAVWRSVISTESITWQSPDVVVPAGQNHVYIYFTFDRPAGVARPMGIAGTAIQLIYPQGALSPSNPWMDSFEFAEPIADLCQCCFTSPTFVGQMGTQLPQNISGITTFGGAVTQLGDYDGEIVIRARLTIPVASPLNNPDVGFVDVSVRRGAFSIGSTLFPREYSSVRITREGVTPPPLTVEFDLGGGTAPGTSLTLAISRNEVIGIANVPMPTRGNYILEGWRYNGQAATSANLTSEQVAEWVVTESGTFIAQWAPAANAEYQIAFHIYTHAARIRDMVADYVTYETSDGILVIHVPVIPGTPRSEWPNQALLNNVLNIGHIYGVPGTPGYAFWGWFQDSALNASGRVSAETGLRRPALRDTCEQNQILQQIEVGNSIFSGDTTLNAFATWALWGDVNDDGIVNWSDLGMLELHLLIRDIEPGFLALNLSAANVYANGIIDWTDFNLLMSYLTKRDVSPGLFNLGIAPQSQPSGGSVMWKSPDVMVPADQNHVYIYFTLDRPAGVARPMGLAGTAIQLAYPRGSFSPQIPFGDSFVFVTPSMDICECCFHFNYSNGRLDIFGPHTLGEIALLGASLTLLSDYDGEIVVRSRLTILPASPLNDPEVGFVDISVQRGEFSIGTTIFPREYSTVRITRGDVAPPPTFIVSFDLGNGTHLGGGDLSQEVPSGANAVLPTVTPPTGYEFSHWDGEHTNITSNRTITAVWRRVITQPRNITWQSPDVIVPIGQNHVYMYFTFDRPAGVARPMGLAATSIQLLYPQGSLNPSIPWASSFVFAEPSTDFCECCFTPSFSGQIGLALPDSIGGITTFGGSVSQLRDYDGEIVIRTRMTIPAASPLNDPNVGFVDVSVRRGAFSLGGTIFPNGYSSVRIKREGVTLPPSLTVKFDLGDGTRTGGGELIQEIPFGTNAVLPLFRPPVGYRFIYWDGDHRNITSDRTITAVWAPLVSTASVTWQSPDVVVPAGQNHVYVYFTFDRPGGVARPMGIAGTSIQLIYPQGSLSPSIPWAGSFEFAEPSVDFCECCFTTPDFTGLLGVASPQSAGGNTVFGASVTQLGNYDGEIVIRARLTIPPASPLNNPSIGFVDVSVRRGEFTSNLGTRFATEYSSVRIMREGIAPPPPTFTVTFDLGDGTHVGGGELSQQVSYGASAVLPAVTPPTGYEFSHWNGTHTNITSNRTIIAVWRRVITQPGSITWQSPDVIVPAGQNHVYIYFTFDRPDGVARPMGFAGTSIQLIYPQAAFVPSNPLSSSFIFAEPSTDLCECCFSNPSFTGQIGIQFPQSIGGITTFGGAVTLLGDHDGEIVIRARLLIPDASPLNNPDVGFVDISVRRGGFSIGGTIFSNEYSSVRVTREGATQQPCPDTNLAHNSLGAVMAASSEHPQRRAVLTNNGVRSGIPVDAWIASDVGSEWLMVDFGQLRSFNTVRIYQAGMRISDYRLEYFDGVRWNSFHEGNRMLVESPNHYEVRTENTMRAQLVRLYSGRSNHATTPIAVFEFEVYYLP